MIGRREVMIGAALGAVPLAASALMSEPVSPPLPPPSGTLRARAAAKGLLVGACLDLPEIVSDQALRAAVARDYNLLVPGNGFNWTRTQQKQGQPLNFSQVEPVYALARAIGAKMRCHALFYDMTTPAWVKALVPTLTPGQAGDLLEDYVRQVVTAWRGKVIHWECVNEPAYYNRPPYRSHVFGQKLGEAHIDLVFKTTQAGDPRGGLRFVNGAALEQKAPIFDEFRTGMLRLLERLLKRGVPVQAVGLESHLRCDYPFSQRALAGFLDEITGMGLKFMITEFDVNDRGAAGGVAARDAAAAALGKAVLDVAFSYRQCLGMLQWTVTDRYSWLHDKASADRQRSDGQKLRPGAFDENYQRKPMWSAVAAAIDAAPRR